MNRDEDDAIARADLSKKLQEFAERNRQRLRALTAKERAILRIRFANDPNVLADIDAIDREMNDEKGTT